MILSWTNVVAILIVAMVTVGKADVCVPRNYGFGSTVCVCNSTYCDSVPRDVPKKGYYRIYESGENGKRMASKLDTFGKSTILSNHNDAVTLTLFPGTRYQSIIGFGGAFTDSASEFIQELGEKTQQRLFEAYFGENGSRYNLGHVPIGSADFSTRTYTYADKKDINLKEFALQREDRKFKIPVMQKALHVNPELIFTSAASSAPEWMKTEHDEYHCGFLKKNYYQTYADYLVKFLEAYKSSDLKIWAISAGNEPVDLGDMTPYKSTMSWSAESMADWIANNLGPSISASESSDTLILAGDDARMYIAKFVRDIFLDSSALNYTAGIAIHANMDHLVSPESLNTFSETYPEKFLIVTEMSVGTLPWKQPVQLGNWIRGEKYILNIIDNLNHHTSGYIDSNLVLERTGRPSHDNSDANIHADAAIIVDPKSNEFYKQPIYYALAHFSKFISRGSVRIGTKTSGDLLHVAFITPDKEIVIVVYNRGPNDRTFVIDDPTEGYILTNIPSRSIQTIIYNT